MKKFSIEFKWAIIANILFLAWMTLEKQLGFHNEKIKWHMAFTLLFFIPSFLIYLLALLDKKKNYYQNNMNWRQGFISAIIISFIVAVFSPLAQFITHEIISPLYFEKLIKLSVENQRMTQEQAENYFNLTSYIWQSISGGISSGVVIGAIVAYLIRTKSV